MVAAMAIDTSIQFDTESSSVPGGDAGATVLGAAAFCARKISEDLGLGLA